MVKYGKLFRELQIEEFKGYYINYKKLKQKIKEIQKILPRISAQLMKNRSSNISNLKLRPTIDNDMDDTDLSQPTDQYGEQLNQFKSLLDEEFQKCFVFFKKIRKQLHNKINKHLYTQTNYTQYTLNEILNEVNNLRKTTYLAKSLNAFINDNMKAIKKILKKFDKKFSNYFGNIGPKYIIENLSKQNSDLEYLLQFKIIDETSCICESNLKLLIECFKEHCSSNRANVNDKNDFESKAREIFGYLKDIDELIYFKIQYKEWFYYIKKDASIISNSNLFKNIMYNPILFSAYHKDDLMNKFLSRKEQLKEVEQMQIPLSISNKINIVLIFIQIFFYNTLISGIYPILFEYIGYIGSREKSFDKEFAPYSLLIIGSTYICSYFSIMFDHYFGNRKIKLAYSISYILFFLGSLAYILSYGNKEANSDEKKYYFIVYLVISRILIGLGANPTMGKKYILSYASKYFLPFISKIYVLVSILGHSIGPLISYFAYNMEEKCYFDIIYICQYNFIGWYGFIISFLLIITHLILFTSPNSLKFKSLKEKNKKYQDLAYSPQGTPFLSDDLDDTQDREFYQLQKEMKLKVESDNSSELSQNLKSSFNEKKSKLKVLSNFDEDINIDEDLKSEGKNGKALKLEEIMKKSNTVRKPSDLGNIIEIKTTNYDINPLLISTNLNNEDIKDETQEEGSFVSINMIPRTIEDLIRKEKKTFGYLNKNLLIILIILFFDNLLKENFVAYSCYFILVKYETDEFYIKYLSCFISLSYLLELFSMPFILPFYRINTLIKKFLITLMIMTILLMIPLSIPKAIEGYFIIYYIIISLVFLISSVIEVVSSCYLAYLTPPEWKFSQINAGALPLYVMTFGKLSGCLICLTAFYNSLFLNYHIIIIITFIGYMISGIFILKSKNFRIKAIARIMRKAELEQNMII